MGHPNLSDHQANERTYLAWMRTSVTLMGFGFVVAKFGLFIRMFSRTQSPPHPFTSGAIGILFVATGAVISVGSGLRYRAIQRHIDAGTYAPKVWPMWLTSGWLTLMAVLLVVYLVATAWG